MFDKYGRGVISWIELSGIMKSLGFPDISNSLLSRAKIDTNPNNSVGLDNKELQKLLHSEEMHAALDYTFNKHNSTYNIRVIKKIISILVSGMLSIEEIREARMSFMLHEGELSSGISLDEKSLLASLRVTGKAIAPKKLQEWIKQLAPDAPNRVQLYEYLDLIKITENKEEVKKTVSLQSTTIRKGGTGLYEITDQNFLLTPDQKLLKKMDDDYENIVTMLQSQQSLPREKNSKETASSTTQRDKASKMEAQLETYLHLKTAILDTNNDLKNARVSGSFKGKDATTLPSIHDSRLDDNKRPVLHFTPSNENVNLAIPEENQFYNESTEIPKRRSWNKIEQFAKDPEFSSRSSNPVGPTKAKVKKLKE